MNCPAIIKRHMHKIAVSLSDIRKATKALQPKIVRASKDINNILHRRWRQAGFMPITLFTDKGNIYASDTAHRLFKDPLKSLLKMEPKSREMFNRIALLHEGQELRAASKGGLKNIIPKFYSHVGPSVILREGNIVSTLPGKYKDVKDAYLNLRNLEISNIQRLFPKYLYSKDRLSRHAIKRISNIINKDVDLYNQAAMNAINKAIKESL